MKENLRENRKMSYPLNKLDEPIKIKNKELVARILISLYKQNKITHNVVDWIRQVNLIECDYEFFPSKKELLKCCVPNYSNIKDLLSTSLSLFKSKEKMFADKDDEKQFEISIKQLLTSMQLMDKKDLLKTPIVNDVKVALSKEQKLVEPLLDIIDYLEIKDFPITRVNLTKFAKQVAKQKDRNYYELISIVYNLTVNQEELDNRFFDILKVSDSDLYILVNNGNIDHMFKYGQQHKTFFNYVLQNFDVNNSKKQSNKQKLSYALAWIIANSNNKSDVYLYHVNDVEPLKLLQENGIKMFFDMNDEPNPQELLLVKDYVEFTDRVKKSVEHYINDWLKDGVIDKTGYESLQLMTAKQLSYKKSMKLI